MENFIETFSNLVYLVLQMKVEEGILKLWVSNGFLMRGFLGIVL